MGEGKQYTTAAYILSNIRHLLYKYMNEDDMSSKKFGDVASIVPDGDEFTQGQSIVHESYIQGSDDSDEWVNVGYYLECFEYLYVITKDLLRSTKAGVTPLMVYDLYFQELLGLTDEQVLERHTISSARWFSYKQKVRQLNDFTDDIKIMLTELAGPVERTILQERDILHIEVQD